MRRENFSPKMSLICRPYLLSVVDLLTECLITKKSATEIAASNPFAFDQEVIALIDSLNDLQISELLRDAAYWIYYASYAATPPKESDNDVWSGEE